ncbi:hypothetical protein LEMLEM_LOCUS11348, partial [Lemmus lemmus]
MGRHKEFMQGNCGCHFHECKKCSDMVNPESWVDAARKTWKSEEGCLLQQTSRVPSTRNRIEFIKIAFRNIR